MTAVLANNILTADQQSSDVAAGWSVNETNTTLTRDTSVFNDSPASVKLVATAAGTVSAKTGYGNVTPVAANTQYVFSTFVRIASSARVTSVLINWIDSASVLISQSNVGATGTQIAGQFVKMTTGILTSPALTTKAEIVITFSNMEAGEAAYFDTSYFGPAPKAKISMLVDDFASFDTAIWAKYGTPSLINNVNGQIEIDANVNQASTQNQLATRGLYDLSESSVYVKKVQEADAQNNALEQMLMVVPSTTLDIALNFTNAFTLSVFFTPSGGGVHTCRYRDGSGTVFDTNFSTGLNNPDWAWWKLRADATNIYWETSADGTNWVTRRTVAISTIAGINLTSMRLALISDIYAGTGNSLLPGIFDNVNTLGVVTPPPSSPENDIYIRWNGVLVATRDRYRIGGVLDGGTVVTPGVYDGYPGIGMFPGSDLFPSGAGTAMIGFEEADFEAADFE